jgi:hypothetical protein
MWSIQGSGIAVYGEGDSVCIRVEKPVGPLAGLEARGAFADLRAVCKGRFAPHAIRGCGRPAERQDRDGVQGTVSGAFPSLVPAKGPHC